jgi:hypothetical protein
VFFFHDLLFSFWAVIFLYTWKRRNFLGGMITQHRCVCVYKTVCGLFALTRCVWYERGGIGEDGRCWM